MKKSTPTPFQKLSTAEQKEVRASEDKERRDAVKGHAVLARVPRKSSFVQKPAGRSGPVIGKRTAR